MCLNFLSSSIFKFISRNSLSRIYSEEERNPNFSLLPTDPNIYNSWSRIPSCISIRSTPDLWNLVILPVIVQLVVTTRYHTLVLSSNRLVSALEIPADNVLICISLHATSNPWRTSGLAALGRSTKRHAFFLSKRKIARTWERRFYIAGRIIGKKIDWEWRYPGGIYAMGMLRGWWGWITRIAIN